MSYVEHILLRQLVYIIAINIMLKKSNRTKYKRVIWDLFNTMTYST